MRYFLFLYNQLIYKYFYFVKNGKKIIINILNLLKNALKKFIYIINYRMKNLFSIIKSLRLY